MILGNKKRKIIVICCVFLAAALLFNGGFLLYDLFSGNGGAVTRISATARGKDKIILKLDCVLPYGYYSVRNVSEDEGEYVGDGMIDYDGGLGKYRIMIEFGDIEPSKELSRQLKTNELFEKLPIGLKAKTAYPSDHGFVLYIGSDTPISVENIENRRFSGARATLRIPISLNAD